MKDLLLFLVKERYGEECFVLAYTYQEAIEKYEADRQSNKYLMDILDKERNDDLVHPVKAPTDVRVIHPSNFIQ